MARDVARHDPWNAAARRRLAWAGACLGLAVVLRFQYGPALAAAVLWQNRLDWRRWGVMAAYGGGVVLLAGGLLDWLTWGAPFQSIWLNTLRNGADGVSSAIGTEPIGFFLAYLDQALWPAPALLFLAAIGAIRAPALGLAALVTLGLHMAVPHKEVRFIYLALAIAPILIGLGLASVLHALAERARRGAVSKGPPVEPTVGASARTSQGLFAASMVGLAVMVLLSWHNATTPALAARWAFNRAEIEAFLAAHRQPGLCGLGVQDMRLIDSGGYAYLHRDVPLLFADFEPEVRLAGARVGLRFAVLRHGVPVAQAPKAEFSATDDRFNHVIAAAGTVPSDFKAVACFNDAARNGKPPLCLFRRDGGCAGG